MQNIIQIPQTIQITDEKTRNWLELSFVTFYDALLMGSSRHECRLRKIRKVHWLNSNKENVYHIEGLFRRLISDSYQAGQALLWGTLPKENIITEQMQYFRDCQMWLLPCMLQGTLDSISCEPLKGETPEEILEEKRERYYTAVYDLLQSQCKKAYYAGYRQVHEAITA